MASQEKQQLTDFIYDCNILKWPWTDFIYDCNILKWPYFVYLQTIFFMN